jgi:hypothetical protein
MKDTREAWRNLRERLHAETQGTKDPQEAVLELSSRYRVLTPEEKREVNEVLGEWALSGDEDLRFDALALISDHKIALALPALYRLAERLEGAAGPAAPYEWAKLNRTIGRLTEVEGGSEG